ncbi:MAG: hypothetical protein NUV74_08465, partial [Candidatus Brocadiaceae bacterium]|nr:hypothetical protein [Candidatus Brocadiaceae bacterium]
MNTITTFFFCTFLFISFVVNVALADEWGLEEQTLKHEKSDSIILHYNGKMWDCIYNGHGVWLNSIYGFDWNDIFAVGEFGIIL